MEAPSRNLALDLVRVTEAAALASARWLGRGDKESGDQAAVDAMRKTFSSLDIDGTVVIGEGEKDDAPMLYNGERVGSGRGLKVDVAVDPVEGTRLLAFGRPNAISVLGVAPAGSMFRPGPSFYMKKLVVPTAAMGVVDLEAPVAENLRKIGKAVGKDVDDLTVFVLDKPRHERLIAEIRAAGARIQLHTDGDVAGSLMAIDPKNNVDVMMGTGGTPEGVLSAIAIRIMGGQMYARLDPQSYDERNALSDFGYDLRHTFTVEDLVKSEDLYFAASGISGGTFLGGVRYTGLGATTYSLSMRGKTGTVRWIEASHKWDTLMQFSSVKYD
ncbi:class II fructose-bisphosphatase [Desulfocurvibacter africanus]|uniref:Fructose-1,6-bisphosphatase n=2 Tax=Desulfocurvibacter africanus TaxID=873 RepID=F3Z3W8_DESAF|nr:class II fructose-bisphosphatase [Desulfocurvibacter africanus]EGJ50420.1 fructose-1,6-bisphosphatase, class II [Desulfocurvibacter africanus subsp. africanus str. Walvis Bay]EMG36803.1 fructose-1,6-bisphosphatase, class II [Desulfocurvibacter africanus PCS]